MPEPAQEVETLEYLDFGTRMERLAGDLNICSQKGLVERFDSTIGAGTVLMPFGGKWQLTCYPKGYDFNFCYDGQ